MSKFFLTIISIVVALISASSVADEKHCAPIACCGCPGNGKSQVNALMNVFLNKLDTDQRDDAFELIKAETAEMYNRYTYCYANEKSIYNYYAYYFPEGSTFRNSERTFVINKDGSVDVSFLAVVVDTSYVTWAYQMTYKWTRDEYCNWHITKIGGITTFCLLEEP